MTQVVLLNFETNNRLPTSMNTLFVPTDLSEHANTALKYALQLSKAFVAKKLVYYHHNPQLIATEIPLTFVEDQIAVNQEIREGMEKTLLKFMDEASIPEQFLKVEVVVSTLISSPAQALLDAARLHKADLIVMGSHGKTGIQKFIFGSVTGAVLEQSPIPVLTIPIGYVFKPIERIAFASSLTYFSSEVKTILEFTEDILPQIDIVHIDYGLMSAQMVGHAKRLIEKLNNPLLNLALVPADAQDSLKENLSKWLKKSNPDWLIMFPVKRDWLEKLFFSSKSLEIAMEFKKPMLIIQKKGE